MNKNLPQKPTQSFTKKNTWFKTTATLLFFILICVNVMQAQSPNLAWVKGIGGTGSDQGKSVAVDGAGNVYTTGFFTGIVDFDPNAGVFNLTTSGSNDIFVSKLDVTGNFVWAKAMGGTAADTGSGIAVDATGNVYVTGNFQGTADYDPDAGVLNLTSGGVQDIFVSKLDPTGNLVWAKVMGGTSADVGNGIAVDATGNVYTTGYFNNTVDFDPSVGIFNLTSGGSFDIFVSKLNAIGTFVWAKAMGGTANDIGYGIAVDATGNVYTTGYFQVTADFDPNTGVSNLTSAGVADIFVNKLDSSGNLAWAKAMGGTGVDVGIGFAVDATGNVYTTGYFQGTVDFDPNAGVLSLTSAGSNDIFVSKLDSLGNLGWAKAMGGTGGDIGNGIAVDATGNVYTTGYFQFTADFDPNAGISNLTAASADIFVSKLDPTGNFAWAKAVGGTGNDVGFGIAVNGGNVHTTGYFAGTADFDPNINISNLTSAGSEDIFVHKMSATAAALNFDGINDRVTVATQPISNLTNFTIEAWVYSTNSGSYQTIYAEGNTLDNNPMFSITRLAGTAGFEIVLRNTVVVGLVVSGTTGKIPLNTWTHVAFARTSATEATLSINGIITDSFTFTNPGTIATNVTNIGVRQRVGFDGYLIGNLDEVRLWNRALPQAEIMNNMNCELPTGQTGLLSYYQFNQGANGADNSTINTLTDASGNSNTGTLTNFALSGTTSNWVLPGGVATGTTCSVLSTNNFDFTSNISVYPNPSSDVFSINSDSSATIIIYDLLGKTIKSVKIESGVSKLDLNGCSNGIYLMKVTNESNQTKTMKLLKQ